MNPARFIVVRAFSFVAAETASLVKLRILVPSVTLSIRGRFCGPFSVGTVDVIKVVRQHAGVSLAEAKALVDRCVFDGETVTISDLTDISARALVSALEALPGASDIDATLV